ncbi:high light inducible protein [Chroococcidiopsis sp. FACHB-1243]|uniref:high light inducible protein n=1 Tax=Chroococcidiopsis sp. [FACHB-1243] TaxID=2692781 RepID=UPI00177BC820|nr:high light inducible protein [Chroococcidiopsis sp. [FACHB-1243]]MBD2309373.1 high light inducible protein [Chroococcidiopsis sp. [FACHB-1243]]
METESSSTNSPLMAQEHNGADRNAWLFGWNPLQNWLEGDITGMNKVAKALYQASSSAFADERTISH